MRFSHAPVRTGLTLLLLLSLPAAVSAQQKVKQLMAPNAAVEKVTRFNTFVFLEGPAWDGRGHVYFSETRFGDIWKTDLNGKCTLVRDKNVYKEGANGLMFTKNGNLAIVERFAGRIALAKPDGTPIRVLAAEYNGKTFTPNDLCLDDKGGVYFSNPTGRNTPETVAPKGVYYTDRNGKVTFVGCDDFGMPNGLIVSEDGSRLYVDDTQSEDFWAFDIKPDGTLENRRVFCKLQLPPGPGTRGRPPISLADGMTTDQEGNLYVSTKLGVQVFDKAGQPLGIIEVPEVPANCTFGGPDYKTLFMTANTALYKIEMRVPGCHMVQP